MKNSNIYAGYRYPAQIISHAVWLYHLFTLSFRDIKELIAATGITVSYETIRNWCDKFGQRYCSQIRKKQGQLGDTWYLDKVFSKINGVLHYLWPAVVLYNKLPNFVAKSATGTNNFSASPNNVRICALAKW